MHRLPLFVCVFLCICSCTKKSVQSLVLKANQGNIPISFVAIDSWLHDKRIIGAGEATHGTHEFATTRLALFQYLVQQKGFTTFMLEADYSACLRLNRYVQGEPDSVYAAIQFIRLWPFVTEEMVNVVHWMRAYNGTNPPNKLSFLGADMQFGNDDVLELRRLFEKYNLTWMGPAAEFSSKPDIAMDTPTLKNWIHFTEQCPQYFAKSSLTNSDARDLQMILSGFQFYLRGKTNKPEATLDYRDSCMASNILQYASLDSNGRIFFWAHNGHVMHYEYRIPGLPRPCGFYLKKALGNGYMALATEMNSGKVYAMNWNNNTGKYEKKISDIEAAPRNTLPWLLAKNKGEIQFMPVTALPYPGRWPMTSIGAAYPNQHNYTKADRFSRLLAGFDGVLFIKNTQPLMVIREY